MKVPFRATAAPALIAPAEKLFTEPPFRTDGDGETAAPDVGGTDPQLTGAPVALFIPR